MYACIHETGRGFLAGVCRKENELLNSRDPPLPWQRRMTLLEVCVFLTSLLSMGPVP